MKIHSLSVLQSNPAPDKVRRSENFLKKSEIKVLDSFGKIDYHGTVSRLSLAVPHNGR